MSAETVSYIEVLSTDKYSSFSAIIRQVKLLPPFRKNMDFLMQNNKKNSFGQQNGPHSLHPKQILLLTFPTEINFTEIFA